MAGVVKSYFKNSMISTLSHVMLKSGAEGHGMDFDRLARPGRLSHANRVLF